MRRTRADDTLSGRSADRGRDLEIFRWGTTISPTTFIDLLAALPDGVTDMTNARVMAETLKAAVITDRLFAGTGEPVDPALLLTPSSGVTARVSVISFVGLQSEEQ